MSDVKLKPKYQHATLRVGGILKIPEVLADFGINPGKVLTDAGINPALLNDPNNLLTTAARSRLLALCVRRTGCKHFGLLAGQRMNLDSFGLLGALIESMPDTGAALRVLVNYFHAHNQGALATLKVHNNIATLRYDVTQFANEANDQTGDGAVAMMLNIMRTLCGPDFQTMEASFAHPKPADIKPFEKLFRAALFFDAQHFALSFSSSWLDMRLPGADTKLQHRLQKQIAARTNSDSNTFADQVSSVLQTALMAGNCNEQQIAAIFGMNVRELIRRLETCNTGFRALLSECRFDIARQMLLTTSFSVDQIAESLGYSRASTFIRAFRRWSGTTPAAWRTQQSLEHSPAQLIV